MKQKSGFRSDFSLTKILCIPKEALETALQKAPKKHKFLRRFKISATLKESHLACFGHIAERPRCFKQLDNAFCCLNIRACLNLFVAHAATGAPLF
jgi:hypothetical protein